MVFRMLPSCCCGPCDECSGEQLPDRGFLLELDGLAFQRFPNANSPPTGTTWDVTGEYELALFPINPGENGCPIGIQTFCRGCTWGDNTTFTFNDNNGTFPIPIWFAVGIWRQGNGQTTLSFRFRPNVGLNSGTTGWIQKLDDEFTKILCLHAAELGPTLNHYLVPTAHIGAVTSSSGYIDFSNVSVNATPLP